jgi:branched-chain amino acid transport system permease protein
LSFYIQTLFITIGINIILAFSFYVPFSAGMISLGQSGFMAIGAYTASILTLKMGLPFFWELLVGGAISGVIGMIVGFPALRIRGLYLMLMTLGFGEAVRVFFINFEYSGGVSGLAGITQKTNIYNVYIFILVLIIIFLRVNSSQIGRIIEAIREEEDAAQGMGINLTKYKIFTFSIGAFIAGIGGGFYAHYAQFIEPSNFGMNQTLEIIIFSIFGGIETFWGSIFGASFLTLLPEWLRPLKEWRMFMYGFVLLLMMVIRPKGVIDKNIVRMVVYRLGFKKG